MEIQENKPINAVTGNPVTLDYTPDGTCSGYAEEGENYAVKAHSDEQGYWWASMEICGNFFQNSSSWSLLECLEELHKNALKTRDFRYQWKPPADLWNPSGNLDSLGDRTNRLVSEQ